MIVELAEVFKRLERSFEEYEKKMKRVGCEFLSIRAGMEDAFSNSYHNLN